MYSESEADVTENQIIKALESGNFSSKELHRIDSTLHRAIRNAHAEEDRQTACAPASELVPDWSLYDPEDGDAEGARKYESAIRELNAAGRFLITSIREGETERILRGFEQISYLQKKHASLGADDTEGREALWVLVQNACKGKEYDPDAIWKRYYCR